MKFTGFYLNKYKNVTNREILPNFRVKIFKRNKDNPKNEKKLKEGNEKMTVRENEMKIQMISENLYKQIFKNCEKSIIAPKLIDRWKKELIKQNIKLDDSPKFPSVDLILPEFHGKNIIEHFYNIANEQIKPYEILINSLISSSIPEKPKNWIFKSGWTKYYPNSDKTIEIDYPDENILVFDIETCMNYGTGKTPILATAVSPNFWYSWVSPDLIELKESRQKISINDLIPLESNSCDLGYNIEDKRKIPKLVIGHNVSFDRARIKEQYWIENLATKFLDTMSLHVSVSGVTSYQRAMLKSHKEMNDEDLEWSAQTSLNSLVDIYKLYCGKELSKERRDMFIDGNLKEIKENFHNLIDYCADDVLATHSVFLKLFPLFKERFKHPATLVGMLEIGSAYLPINNNWERYIKEADLAYEDLDTESRYHLKKKADNACHLLKNDKYKNDLWIWDEDWSVQELKMKSTKIKESLNNTNISLSEEYTKNLNSDEQKEFFGLNNKFNSLIEIVKQKLPSRRPLLPGYPAWYRKLCTKSNTAGWIPGAQSIGTGMQIVPKLLRLCWEGYPLHYIRNQGWGFIVPYRSIRDSPDINDKIPLDELIKKCPVVDSIASASQRESEEAFSNLHKNVEIDISKKDFYKKKKKTKEHMNQYNGTGVWCNLDLEHCCWFFKLPHKNGTSYRVGNPLAKDFISKFSENVLTGDSETAKRIIEIAKMLSYWRNNRDRIKNQMAVWLDDSKSISDDLKKCGKVFGAILPQVVVCGTLTRRAMEPTWMTASNAQLDRVGSELRSMIQSPPGYKIVGADVDSQELWIASVLGDATATGIHGATPLGWMTLSGSKSTGTDMHSITANAVGISRDHAKVINYARIYGAGQNFAERLLKQFNPTISDNEARSKAMKMFSLTKGKKFYYLKEDFDDNLENRGYTSFEASKLSKAYGKPMNEMFKKAKWYGGTESAMFNRLEEIAGSNQPVTPFLNCRLSRALESNGENSDDRFLPTRINWVVQSGAVDFLHLMLVCMRWLMKDKIRFCLSFHDEVRYLVKNEDVYKAALAMHVTNLLTRSYCVSKIGLNDLPQSVAFFTSVEIDNVLRKESQMDCKTPSNPYGLNSGYEIPPGESLDIYETIKKAGNDLSKWTC